MMPLGLDTISQEFVRSGMLIALGLIVLSQFLNIGVGTAASNAAINAFITAISTIPSWAGIIVVVFMGALIYGLSNMVGGGRRV